MNQDLLPLEGGCRCGGVRIRVTAPPLLTAACHCSGCQRMSSSAFSLSAIFPSDAFSVTQGEPVIGGLHDKELAHFFCPHCMSWMFTRPAAIEAIVNVRPTMFDNAAWFVPFIETYTSEKLPWATTPAMHRFEQFPPFELYESLTQEYAAYTSEIDSR
ncbi:GFA family protein [Billgrantia antri]|uniref:GFA family protein n=1 Tax=Halomonas sulfidivorans TaxID=2733488 RepID=A0ABX7WGC8_9GAMM|nr:GFA family protein [Halomonas sulfidivorans]QTP59410.1 GFA family protein [Halomonas sulfidivorans]